jgi:hypothetical protein
MMTVANGLSLLVGSLDRATAQGTRQTSLVLRQMHAGLLASADTASAIDSAARQRAQSTTAGSPNKDARAHG